ncbi:Com family DNA-binding transcriptional regulator [Telmatospirillum sp. J64-1]|uniref:Com family DNA-binding transcriptional regulator n=1 Tax=Telmatospirillum sp. J64-1 TaxID=2502183 RepID=UPI00115E756E
MESIRCGSCRRLLAKAAAYQAIEIKCPRCGTINRLMRAESPAPERPGAPSPEPTWPPTTTMPQFGRSHR